MPVNVLMPALSPTMTEGTLAKWIKNEGDKVKSGDVIAEIETDKATMEVEAVDEGTLGKILVPAGTQNVAVNSVIALILEEGESADEAAKPVDVPKPSPQPSPSRERESAAAPSSIPSPSGRGKGEGVRSETSDRIFASPLAKRLAEQKGIDLSSIKGSGPRGRIVKSDLDGAKAGASPAAKTAATPAPKAAGTSPFGPDAKQLADMLGMEYTATPNSGIRKTIARRLSESKQTVPHFYLTIECRIDSLLAIRQQMNDEAKGAYKLSVNDFVVKACAAALKAYPAANVAWTEDAILQYKHADISVAVSTPNGLMTPIVKHAEEKGLKQISSEVKDLALRARDGKLKPEEFQGGTFTVSNLGMFGIKSFGAIINPPQSCILAVGAGEEKPYVHKGEIKIGTFMTCTLSVDHRSVDGSVCAEYLQILKQYIENPTAMLL